MSRFLGNLLKGFHAGESSLAWHSPVLDQVPDTIRLTSASFMAGGAIPLQYAGPGVGQDISPDLQWTGVPDDAVEWVLVIEDADAPLPRPFVHLIAWGISVRTTHFREGELSLTSNHALNSSVLNFGRNTFGGRGYSGPRALPGHGPHCYSFQIFALNRRLSFLRTPNLKDVLNAIQGAVIARGRLDGFFEQK